MLVSMPFDVIKTYMQTHGAEAAAAGAGGQLAAFWATGAGMLLLLGVWSLLLCCCSKCTSWCGVPYKHSILRV